MKKLTTTIVLAFISFVFVSAQGCLPDGIHFTTQEEIDNFQTNYPGCTEIEGDVTIRGYYDITNLEGLNIITSIGGDLWIGDAFYFTNLSGLESLTTIGGTLAIGDAAADHPNLALTSLEGLDNLTTIGGSLNIYGNPVLETLTGIENLTSIGENMYIGQFHQAGNFELTTLEALSNLITVGGSVMIYGNPMLTSLEGLENLPSIGGGIYIAYNGISNLIGFSGLNSIGGDLVIGYGAVSTVNLTSLEGLENLTSIGGKLSIGGNDTLTSLTGIDNINPGSISDLYIYDNGLLSACDVQSICDYLAAPSGTIEIHDNAVGCNSQEEVEEACIIDGIEETELIAITLHPNPTDNGSITITLDNQQNLHLTCFNTFGQQVHQHEVRSAETVISVDTWTSGIYLVVVYEDGKPVGQTKFIVQ